MAKLPSAYDLGPLNTGGGLRPVALADASGYANAGRAIVQGAQNLGQGISRAVNDISAVDAQEAAKNTQLEVARANANTTVKLLDQSSALSQDQEPDPVKYGTNANTAITEAASGITDPRARQLFIEQSKDNAARIRIGAEQRLQTLNRDKAMAADMDTLTTLRNRGINNPDPGAIKITNESATKLIDSWQAKGYITATQAQQMRRTWVSEFVEGKVNTLPPLERVETLQGFDRGLMQRESSGDPRKMNQLGYAGLYQFGAPRLVDLGVYAPGGAENIATWSKGGTNKWTGTFNIPGHPEVKTIEDFRNNAAAQQAVYAIHTQKMDQEIEQQGLAQYIGKPIGGVVMTREAIKAMMHLGGAGGAKKYLASGGEVDPADANGTKLSDYAKLGARTGGGTLSDAAMQFIDPSKRNAMLVTAQNDVLQLATKASQAQSETFERMVIDASAGLAPLPPRSAIEQDPMLAPPQRNDLLRKWDEAAKTIQVADGVQRRMESGQPLNGFDDNDRKGVETLFKRMGANDDAANVIVQRTGIVPKATAAAIRGALVSGNPTEATTRLSFAANAITRNAGAFAGVEGAAQIEASATAFQHYRDALGLTPDQAARKVMQDASPEYQRELKTRLKGEDIDKIIRDDLTQSNMSGPFAPSWGETALTLLGEFRWAGSPDVGFQPRDRALMFNDFAELVKESYLTTANGDIDVAKQQAANQLRKVWGVTTITGKPVLTKYPPERAPYYRGAINLKETDKRDERMADLIASDAVAAVKAEGGGDVPRQRIRLIPIDGVTAEQYREGKRPPQYALEWDDTNGVTHVLNTTRGFQAPISGINDVLSQEQSTIYQQSQEKKEPGQAQQRRARDMSRTRQLRSGTPRLMPSDTTLPEAQ